MSGHILPETDVFEMTDAQGGICRIMVSRPDDAPPPHGFPVLTVLDGDTIFASFAEARRLFRIRHEEIGRSIVVAVGYPDAAPYSHPRRRFDFTPPDPDPLPPEIARITHHPGGGADAFAAFLTGPLRDRIAERYPVDPARQALFGHSLGGLFALRHLYAQPRAWRAVIAASPAQWWHPGIHAEERAFAAALAEGSAADPARLLILTGAEETLEEDARALARRLAPLSAHGFRSRLLAYPDETHVTVPARAVTDALRFAFAWP